MEFILLDVDVSQIFDKIESSPIYKFFLLLTVILTILGAYAKANGNENPRTVWYTSLGLLFLICAGTFLVIYFDVNADNKHENSLKTAAVKVLEYKSTLEHDQELENILLNMSPLDENRFVREVRKKDSLKLVDFVNKRLVDSGKKMDQGQKQTLISSVLQTRKMEGLKDEMSIDFKMRRGISKILKEFSRRKDLSGAVRLLVKWGIDQNTALYSFDGKNGIKQRLSTTIKTYLMEKMYNINPSSNITIAFIEYNYPKISSLGFQK